MRRLQDLRDVDPGQSKELSAQFVSFLASRAPRVGLPLCRWAGGSFGSLGVTVQQVGDLTLNIKYCLLSPVFRGASP